ncbi:hypothetical protein DL96DRAFT_1623863 [Flagelloscypha sp. PMI_526]|nr:hypothetical protein DL96DRAFT_1623863 [Flagelloscypha sp. PMI_526]
MLEGWKAEDGRPMGPQAVLRSVASSLEVFFLGTFYLGVVKGFSSGFFLPSHIIPLIELFFLEFRNCLSETLRPPSNPTPPSTPLGLEAAAWPSFGALLERQRNLKRLDVWFPSMITGEIDGIDGWVERDCLTIGSNEDENRSNSFNSTSFP